MKILWVDLLCFKTFLIACFSKNRDFERIHYINIHKSFVPFINFASKIIGKPIICIDYVVESEEYINNIQLYDVIQKRIHTLLEQWIKNPNINKRIKKFIYKTGFNKDTYTSYLKENAYFFAFMPIEIYFIAEVFGSNFNNVFLLKKTPLNVEIKSLFEPKLINFYSYRSHSILIRKNHWNDSAFSKNYYRGNFYPSIKLLFTWSIISFSSLFNKKHSNSLNKTNIAAELIQAKVKQNDISDTYWIKDSNIDLNSIVGLTSIDYDLDSLSNLNTLGIKVFNISGSVLKLIINTLRNYNVNYQPTYIFVDYKYFMRTFNTAFKIFYSMFFNSSFSWFNIQEVYYLIRTEFWKSIYNQLDICILWTMYDADRDKLVKSQAIEICNGLYCGSHRSNNPSLEVWVEKHYDVFFVWSKYFLSKSFYPNSYVKTAFEVGYSSDHYFKYARMHSAELRKKYSNFFILSYFDNVTGNDIRWSPSQQFEIYKLLINLLNTRKELIIFLKPKRKSRFLTFLSSFDPLRVFVDNGRVVVFYGDSEKTKARPAEIAIASDLVLGLGISSAAAEGCFAGSVAFHANLTKVNNDFDKHGLNKVVFREIKSLEKAIINQMNGNGMSIEESQSYHKILDPFQDGLAFKRTGAILANIQKQLNQSHNLKKVVKNTKNKFLDLSC